MHKCLYLDLNVNAITASIQLLNVNCYATMIHIIHNIADEKQQLTNAFIMRLVLHYVNAILTSILPQSA